MAQGEWCCITGPRGYPSCCAVERGVSLDRQSDRALLASDANAGGAVTTMTNRAAYSAGADHNRCGFGTRRGSLRTDSYPRGAAEYTACAREVHRPRRWGPSRRTCRFELRTSSKPHSDVSADVRRGVVGRHGWPNRCFRSALFDKTTLATSRRNAPRVHSRYDLWRVRHQGHGSRWGAEVSARVANTQATSRPLQRHLR
jgi:hypothetical protein